jgi:hypothetical protein
MFRIGVRVVSNGHATSDLGNGHVEENGTIPEGDQFAVVEKYAFDDHEGITCGLGRGGRTSLTRGFIERRGAVGAVARCLEWLQRK